MTATTQEAAPKSPLYWGWSIEHHGYVLYARHPLYGPTYMGCTVAEAQKWAATVDWCSGKVRAR